MIDYQSRIEVIYDLKGGLEINDYPDGEGRPIAYTIPKEKGSHIWGAGEAEVLWDWLLGYMHENAAKMGHDFLEVYGDKEKAAYIETVKLVRDDPVAAAALIACLLLKEELIECASLPAAWLTERGKQFLEAGKPRYAF